jgi:hypothetical protein
VLAGDVAEWLKAAVCFTVKGQKPFTGSNPVISAIIQRSEVRDQRSGRTSSFFSTDL